MNDGRVSRGVKGADRPHQNTRTRGFLSREKQQGKTPAKHSIFIHRSRTRLRMGLIRGELEDIAFRAYLEPGGLQQLQNTVMSQKRKEFEAFLRIEGNDSRNGLDER